LLMPDFSLFAGTSEPTTELPQLGDPEERADVGIVPNADLRVANFGKANAQPLGHVAPDSQNRVGSFRRPRSLLLSSSRRSKFTG
jgi:hypothetical protein